MKAAGRNLRERMGSGGPRGLQILRSGANSVRGGFDSHAFPPLSWMRVAGAVVALACAVLRGAPAIAAGSHAGAMRGAWADAPAAAPFAPCAAFLPHAEAAADSVVNVVVPEGGVVEVPPRADTAGAGGAAPARGATPARRPMTGFEAPGWVMARSLVVPGWGQLHNGSWIKAILVATGETMLVTRMVKDNRELDDLNREIEAARLDGDDVREVAAVEAYNTTLNDLVRRQWWFGALLTYALLDAYIDAHFRDFDVEFRHDPALPEGVDPAGGAPAERKTSGVTRLALRWSF